MAFAPFATFFRYARHGRLVSNVRLPIQEVLAAQSGLRGGATVASRALAPLVARGRMATGWSSERSSPITLFILRAERPSCRLPPVWQRMPSTPHCSTVLIHSTHLGRQRTSAVECLASDVTQVVICGGFFQKKGEIVQMLRNTLFSKTSNFKLSAKI